MRTPSEELTDYTDLASDEWSEGLDTLMSLERYTYVFSDEFNDAVQKEIAAQLADVKSRAKIVKKEETYTYTRKYSELVWDDGDDDGED